MSQPAAPKPPRPRPPRWFFVVVAVLILVGVFAPLTVGWLIERQEATIPADTTGNRTDSAPAPGARGSSARPQ